MKAYYYENTKTNIPNWESTIHLTQRFGYGYETDTHFVHFYGMEDFYIISVGLTVIEAKSGTLEEWIRNRFGAINIREMCHEVGTTVEGIWRPALYNWDDIDKAINVNSTELRSQEQALRILIEKLDQILLYVEPSPEGLESFSHKTREILILSCTEVENQWKVLLGKAGCSPVNGNTFTTQDYVKLLPATFIKEYQVSLREYAGSPPSRPFEGWNSTSPTKSLTWYDAYNKTKHSRDLHFSESKLKYAIEAVAANIVLYSTRFGPLRQLHGTSFLSGLVKQLFEIRMLDSDRSSFYIPELSFSADTRKDCFVFDCYANRINKPWKMSAFSI